MVTQEQADIISVQAKNYVNSEKPTLKELVDNYIANKITAVFFMFAYLTAWKTKGLKSEINDDVAITIFSCCDDFDYLGLDDEQDDSLSINETEFRKRIELCSQGKWQEVREMMTRN